ncbi:MAG: putative Zn-dependent protease [Gammaproteobacteria bacterium]|jgi:predicted Zn-dependent protease
MLYIVPSAAQNLTSFEQVSPSVDYSAEELKLGRQFMRGAFKQLDYSRDPELTTYIESLGNKIVEGAGVAKEKFSFFLVNNPNLNAFAAPGGYITLHTGLLAHTATESELASVVGHEVAHITQRHLPRMIERARQRSLPAAAAMVAAILVGGQLGSAALVSANAAMAADQLRYSRDFEREADSVGLRLLASSGFSPADMPKFFTKLHKQSSLSSVSVPEYLRSHPLSINRIAATEARAIDYPATALKPSMSFMHLKERAEVLAEQAAGRVMEYTPVSDYADVKERSVAYGNLLRAIRNTDYALALELVEKLLQFDADNYYYLLAKGQLWMAENKYSEAIDEFSLIKSIYPSRPEPVFYLVRAQIAATDYKDARKTLRQWMRQNPDSAIAWSILSRIEGELGNLVAAFQARAEYFDLLFDPKRALHELIQARKHAEGNFYLTSSIEARELELNEDMRRFGELEQLQN